MSGLKYLTQYQRDWLMFTLPHLVHDAKDREDIRQWLTDLNTERERTAALEAKLALVQAQADGTGSLLLDVQQDCIALRKEIRKRVEKWSADACDLAPFECASDLEAALKENDDG